MTPLLRPQVITGSKGSRGDLVMNEQRCWVGWQYQRRNCDTSNTGGKKILWDHSNRSRVMTGWGTKFKCMEEMMCVELPHSIKVKRGMGISELWRDGVTNREIRLRESCRVWIGVDCVWRQNSMVSQSLQNCIHHCIRMLHGWTVHKMQHVLALYFWLRFSGTVSALELTRKGQSK